MALGRWRAAGVAQPILRQRDQFLVAARQCAVQRLLLERGILEKLRELEANRQVVLRYGEPCNGSVDDIAGICNEGGNVFGLMPHPEHAVDPLLGSADGALILASLVDAARARALSVV